MNKQMCITAGEDRIGPAGFGLKSSSLVVVLKPRRLRRVYCCWTRYGCPTEAQTKSRPPVQDLPRTAAV